MSNVRSNASPIHKLARGFKTAASEAFEFLSCAEEGIEMLADEVVCPAVEQALSPESKDSYVQLFPLRRKTKIEFSQDLEKDQLGGLYCVTEAQANTMIVFMQGVSPPSSVTPNYSTHSMRQLGPKPLTFIPEIPLNECLNCKSIWGCPAHIFMDYQQDLNALMARDAATNIVKGISPELVTDFLDAKRKADHCYLSSVSKTGDCQTGYIVTVTFKNDSDSHGVVDHYAYSRSLGMGNKITKLGRVPADFDNAHLVAFKLE